MEEARAAIDGAKRPAIVVGYGSREHLGKVIALAEKLGAPVLTTFKAKGLVSDSPPPGLRGTRAKRYARRELVHERSGVLGDVGVVCGQLDATRP